MGGTLVLPVALLVRPDDEVPLDVTGRLDDDKKHGGVIVSVTVEGVQVGVTVILVGVQLSTVVSVIVSGVQVGVNVNTDAVQLSICVSVIVSGVQVGVIVLSVQLSLVVSVVVVVTTLLEHEGCMVIVVGTQLGVELAPVSEGVDKEVEGDSVSVGVGSVEHSLELEILVGKGGLFVEVSVSVG